LGQFQQIFLNGFKKMEGLAFFRFHFFANTSKGFLVSRVKTYTVDESVKAPSEQFRLFGWFSRTVQKMSMIREF